MSATPAPANVSRRLSKWMRQVLESCCLGLLVAGMAAGAQARDEIITAGTGAVSGRVFCADTQKPARFAQVRLFRTDDGSGGGRGSGGVTGADGSFSLTNVRAGEYYISAQMPGYMDLLGGFAPRGARTDPSDLPDSQLALLTRVDVSENQTVSVAVSVYRGAVLAGNLTYDDGSPAIGIPVSAQLIAEMDASGKQASPVANVRDVAFANTGDRGDFRLGGLPDGVYLVRARPRGTNGPGTLPVYFPNTLKRSDARQVAVKAGEERIGIDMQIPALSLRQVSGSVQAARDGHGIARAMVSLTLTGENGDTLNAVSSMDGSFHILGVPNGRFTVRVSGASDVTAGRVGNGETAESATSYGAGQQNIEVNGSDVDNVVLSLPAMGISGGGVQR